MFKVLQYSLGYTFRKKSTSILLSFLLVFSFLIPFVSYKSSIIVGEHAKADGFFLGIQSVLLIPIFLLFISFVAVVVGQIFKRGEEDGTTLMLVSSRYTRTQVILGRFGAILVHLLISALVIAFAMAIASLLWKPSEARYEIISFISILFGAFFIGLLFASLSLIFSILMGRIGAIVTSIFMFVFAAVLAPILVASTGNNSDALSLLTNFDTSYGKYASYETFVYEDSNKKIDTQDLVKQQLPQQNEQTRLQNLSNAKYQSIGWIDPWTQLSQMMGIFSPKQDLPSSLDNISITDISESDFFKGFTTLDTDTSLSLKTISNPELKMAFGLASVLKRITQETSSDDYTNNAIVLTEILRKLTDEVKTSEFSDSVNAYIPIVKQLNDQEVKSVNSYGGQLPLSAFAGLVDAVKNGLNIAPNSVLDYEISSSKNRVLKDFEINGQPNPEVIRYTSSGKDELYNNFDKLLKRIAIYYAIFKTDKGYVTDQLSLNSTSSSDGKIKDVIKDNFKNYFSAELQQETRTDAALKIQFGSSYTASPIVPPAFIYTFWPAVSLGLFGLAYWIHRRTDFK